MKNYEYLVRDECGLTSYKGFITFRMLNSEDRMPEFVVIASWEDCETIWFCEDGQGVLNLREYYEIECAGALVHFLVLRYECLLASSKSSVVVKLFDDESVREKLTVMSKMEAIFDDARNDTDQYFSDVDAMLQPGRSYKITIEEVNESPETH